MSEDLRALAGRVERGVASPEETARFERLLESGALDAARLSVRALPEDTPSLEWRSALNEELRRRAPRRRLRRWLPQTAMGFALAGALAMAVFWPRGGGEPTPARQGAKSLEAFLVATHLEYVHSADLAGAGLTPQDFGVAHQARPDPGPHDWVEGDLSL